MAWHDSDYVEETDYEAPEEPRRKVFPIFLVVVLAVVGTASAFAWRAYRGNSSFALKSNITAPAEPEMGGIGEFHAFQQQIAGLLQSNPQALAAQQAEVERLSEQKARMDNILLALISVAMASAAFWAAHWLDKLTIRRTNEIRSRGSTGSRLEQFQQQKRRRTKTFRLIGYLCVLMGSSSVTLVILHLNHQSDELERAALKEALMELELARSNAAPVVSGSRVYSPSTGTGDIYSPDRAFDGSQNPDSFWETHRFPVDLIALLPQPRILTNYTISAGATTNRMPTTWVLEGLSEDRAWIPLDQQKGVTRWGPEETRRFRIEPAVPVNALRFQFRAGFDPEILRIYKIEIH